MFNYNFTGTYKFIIVGKNLWQNSNLKEALKVSLLSDSNNFA